MAYSLKGNETLSGDLRAASLGVGKVSDALNFGGGGGGGLSAPSNPVIPERDDSGNSDARGRSAGIAFLPDNDAGALPVSKPTGARSFLNFGAQDNGSIMEELQKPSFVPAKDFVPDVVPDVGPLDKQPAEPVEPDIMDFADNTADFADNTAAYGNDTYLNGGGFGQNGFYDASGFLGTASDLGRVSVSSRSAKGKKLYIFLIVVAAIGVIIYLSRSKKSKKR